MHFIDEAKIFLKSGGGGAGCVSFRREANLPKGGPDGGDGGRGGSIILRCIGGLNTLIDYRYQQHFKAQRGHHGQGSNCTGKSGQDIILEVPMGTQVLAEDGETLLADMTAVGQEVVMAKGGNGGLGNTHFKSSINRAPRRVTPGEEGQELWVWLKLKLLSDAGLLGLPNAGKSTFLSAVSRAKPKIADYPFTTLKPQLGVASIDGKEFVVADIPGLIEGAHEGVGLGIRFLKHIERCGVLLHLIEGTQEDVVAAYRTVRGELSAYSPLLEEKTEILVLNKIDAIPAEEQDKKKKKLEKASKKKVLLASAATGNGVTPVLRQAYQAILDFRAENDKPEEPEEPVSKPYSPV